MIQGFLVTDAHCHVYPDRFAQRSVEAVDELYGMKHAYDGTLETLLKEGASAGIDRFVLCSVAVTAYHVRALDRFLDEAARGLGGRACALGAYYPFSRSREKDVRESFDRGLHGFKIHPEIQKCPVDDPGYAPLYGLCAGTGLPVLVHTGEDPSGHCAPERFARVCREYPDTVFVGAHLGGFRAWERAKACLAGADLPNLYVDISSVFPFLPDGQVTELIRAYGPERCMFGTDYPGWPLGDDAQRLLRLPLRAEEKEQILSLNAQSVYRFGQT